MTACNGSHDDGIADGNPTGCSAVSGCGRSGCSAECGAGVSAVTARVNLDSSHLSAACDALGEIMMALTGRALLSKCSNPIISAKLESDARTDEELAEIAATAFEEAAMALVAAWAPRRVGPQLQSNGGVMIEPLDLDAARAICGAVPAGPWAEGSRGAIFDRTGGLVCVADESTWRGKPTNAAHTIERFIERLQSALIEACELAAGSINIALTMDELRALLDRLAQLRELAKP